MTRILHASIPADRPDEVAHALARMMGGTALPARRPPRLDCLGR